MRNLFLVSNLFLWSMILGPVFYYLWIELGSANSNFFYAITLVWALAQIFLVVDVAWSQLRREWDRLQGGWRGIAVQHK
jgi:phosphatidylinositol glycan class U